ncbi:helix-turn-helix transcriptional regulator [Enterobacter sp. Ap-916]|uniref:winged helix-turn-helix transcriptional regulator n=1 Tax=Enterobacteriaceae TaxID=543 RepID=UPI001421CAE0|nr:helix-turn-helix transcriptional regulator [Enterobacter sp. Ap-867]NIG30986.1 helix-turn-helix transcriptional regulator [Enterobacter sp. Ap-916]
MDYNAPYGCSVTTTLKVIGGRWKPVILFHLMENGVCRFNELRRMIDGITQRMLTSQLKELVEDGIIIRVVIESSPPHVEYSLTKYGSTLENILKEMRDWGAQHAEILNNYHSSGL